MFSGHWALGQVWNTTLLVLNLYLLAAFIIYGIKSRKYSHESKSDVERCNGRLNYAIATFGVVSPLPRILMTQGVLVVGAKYKTGDACEKMIEASVVCYFIAYWAIYFFLWYRQFLFYTHPLLKHNFHKFPRFISWFSLVIFNFVGVGILFLYLFPKDYKGSDIGCVKLSANESLMWNNSEFYSRKKPYVLFSAVIFCQVTLFALFVYPLMKNRGMQRKARDCPSHKPDLQKCHKKKSPSILQKIRKSHKRNFTIYMVIKKSTISMAVTVLSELTSLAIVESFVIPLHIENCTYDTSLLVNILCIIATFTDWKQICYPFSKQENETDSDTTDSTAI